LLHLGKESFNADRVKLYCSAKMFSFLNDNKPWSDLFEWQNLECCALEPFESSGDRTSVAIHLDTDQTLSVKAVAVPHRADDTMAFIVARRNGKRLLYCPDTDELQSWQPSLSHWLKSIDYLLLDGTFYSFKELPGSMFLILFAVCVFEKLNF
jgi:pyrroloquinoline quinone biosynthesis protein B